MGRATNRLSVLEIKRPRQPGLYADGDGLYLQVSQHLTKSWIFRFMMRGTARKMGLGQVERVSLADARKKAKAAHSLVIDGIDPIAERDARRMAAAVDQAKTVSFKFCADQYIAANEAGWTNAAHRAQWFSSFNDTKRGKLQFPALTACINDLPVSQVDTALVLKVLSPIWTTKPETAGRLRGRIETVLDWATVSGFRSGENPARWRGHLDKVLPTRSKVRKVKHHAAMPYQDVPAFISELRQQAGASARALEFCILNVTRTSETICAEWTEFANNTGTWIIPADRMKAKREHRIGMSDRALEILYGMPKDSPLVFPGRKSAKAKPRPLSNMAMLELLRDMRPGLTVHGFRSSFRDWAEEQTSHSAHAIEMALAHAIGDKVEAAYRRGELFEKRKILMADWAKYCGSGVSS
jgi:integrase